MSKKSARRKQSAPLSSGAVKALDRAYELIEDHEWDEAGEILERFVQQHPSHVDALAMLADVYQNQGRTDRLWELCIRLVQLDPRQPENWYNAMVASMVNGLPFSARRYGQHFVSTWPEHPQAKEARKILETLDKACTELLQDEHTEPGATDEDFMLFEEAEVWMSLGRFQKVQQITQEALQRLPHAAAPRNNLSLAYSLEGKFDEAIAMAREVLAEHPDNVHALSNLAQFLVRSGQRDEALQAAERLRAEPLADEPLVAKQLEAMTFLGDDRAVIDLFEQFERTNKDRRVPLVNHLAAVAYARQGDLKRARQLWEAALKLDRNFGPARANLDDLKQPVGDQNGPWSFPFNQWVPRPWIKRLSEAMIKGRRSDAVAKREVERLLQTIPGLAVVIPILFERGDAEGRELALHVASTAGLPVLREFALSQNGPDSLRIRAAQEAARLGLLPRGETVPLYVQGKQTDILLMGYEIYSEPQPDKLPKRAERLLEETHEMLSQGEFREAEPLVREALSIVPNYPTFMNYLTVILTQLKRDSEAKELARKVVELHPDYLFGRCAVAQFAVREGRFDEAHQWLDPLLTQERFHISEFAAFCGAYASLLAAEKKPDAARSWLEMWKSADPDSGPLRALRRQLRL